LPSEEKFKGFGVSLRHLRRLLLSRYEVFVIGGGNTWSRSALPTNCIEGHRGAPARPLRRAHPAGAPVQNEDLMIWNSAINEIKGERESEQGHRRAAEERHDRRAHGVARACLIAIGHAPVLNSWKDQTG
jgi:thioredoxin reductase